MGMSHEGIRELAASTYNAAFETVEAADDLPLAIELAATSLHLWRQVGNSQNFAIGCWLYSRALAVADVGTLAVQVAAECMQHVSEIENPPDWLVASSLEGWARALVAAGDERAAAAIESARTSIAAILDPSDRALIQSQFSDLKM